MSFTDKATNKAQEMLGSAKEKTGAALGNDDLERDGQADQAKATTKQAAENITDAASNITDNVASLTRDTTK